MWQNFPHHEPTQAITTERVPTTRPARDGWRSRSF